MAVRRFLLLVCAFCCAAICKTNGIHSNIIKTGNEKQHVQSQQQTAPLNGDNQLRSSAEDSFLHEQKNKAMAILAKAQQSDNNASPGNSSKFVPERSTMQKTEKQHSKRKFLKETYDRLLKKKKSNTTKIDFPLVGNFILRETSDLDKPSQAIVSKAFADLKETGDNIRGLNGDSVSRDDHMDTVFEVTSAKKNIVQERDDVMDAEKQVSHFNVEQGRMRGKMEQNLLEKSDDIISLKDATKMEKLNMMKTLIKGVINNTSRLSEQLSLREQLDGHDSLPGDVVLETPKAGAVNHVSNQVVRKTSKDVDKFNPDGSARYNAVHDLKGVAKTEVQETYPYTDNKKGEEKVDFNLVTYKDPETTTRRIDHDNTVVEFADEKMRDGKESSKYVASRPIKNMTRPVMLKDAGTMERFHLLSHLQNEHHEKQVLDQHKPTTPALKKKEQRQKEQGQKERNAQKKTEASAVEVALNEGMTADNAQVDSRGTDLAKPDRPKQGKLKGLPLEKVQKGDNNSIYDDGNGNDEDEDSDGNSDDAFWTDVDKQQKKYNKYSKKINNRFNKMDKMMRAQYRKQAEKSKTQQEERLKLSKAYWNKLQKVNAQSLLVGNNTTAIQPMFDSTTSRKFIGEVLSAIGDHALINNALPLLNSSQRVNTAYQDYVKGPTSADRVKHLSRSKLIITTEEDEEEEKKQNEKNNNVANYDQQHNILAGHGNVEVGALGDVHQWRMVNEDSVIKEDMVDKQNKTPQHATIRKQDKPEIVEVHITQQMRNGLRGLSNKSSADLVRMSDQQVANKQKKTLEEKDVDDMEVKQMTPAESARRTFAGTVFSDDATLLLSYNRALNRTDESGANQEVLKSRLSAAKSFLKNTKKIIHIKRNSIAKRRE